MKQLIETVEDLEKRGIGFRSLTEAIDTTTPGGKLIFHVFAGLTEFERGLIRERTRAGLNVGLAYLFGQIHRFQPRFRDAKASIIWKVLVSELGADIGARSSSLCPLPIPDR